MNTLKNTRKGFYTVEAAIFLPIFIIGVLTLGYMIKVIGAGEDAVHILCDEAGRQAKNAYVMKVDISMPYKIEQRILDTAKDIDEADVRNFIYLYPWGDFSDLISCTLEYEVRVKLPMGLYDGFHREEKLLFRGFTGVSFEKASMPQEELEKEEELDTVWVFPRAGEKYHKENCTYIKVYPLEIQLNRDIRRRYDPCGLCDAERLKDGNLVYCFPKAGGAYHHGACATVDKYVIKMEREDAEEKGYGSCLKCGG